MMSASSHQYACTICFNWFKFEQLTQDSQLCEDCSKTKEDDKILNGKKEQKKSSTRRTMRCKCCRTELQGNVQMRAHLCDRCSRNKIDYGEPKDCSLCKLPAAFIGSKCRRCAASVKKYGPPQQCHQCKLKAAFQHPKAQLGGKNLCWLCASTAQKAMKRMKRKASEDEKAHMAKVSKTVVSYSGSGDSPTELVIEEEVIHEKDSDWDDFHDMDYRLPPAAMMAEKVSAVKVEKEKSPTELDTFTRTESRRKKTMSPAIAEEPNGKHSCRKPAVKMKEAKPIKNELKKSHKLDPKFSRRSAPSQLNPANNKHAKSTSSNHKADLNASTSKLLDAKILRLQKKLSHKKGMKPFVASPKKSKPEKEPTQKDDKRADTSSTMTSTKPAEPGPASLSAFKMADSGPSSLSAFKVTDSGVPASLTLEKFKSTDSASSSPLPVVNDGNIVLVTQLRAEISSLKKQVGKKDQEMIEKDKQISCIKVEHLREQRELRAKMKELIAKHAEVLEQLKTKNQDLLKKISQLSKGRA